ncbi:AMP-binding protein [Prauserella endophytica]|uniref:Fatty-acid--CoA ligase n=1 Tax=Prauserella endophytica TaxID=1592324 RepID=A0ABY2S4Z6_9PSEU|nr:AMP-binding protein [Prauserella endophytica]TKG70974.1 fatty-acid--CoA ligase [Prauserella endophytica]
MELGPIAERAEEQPDAVAVVDDARSLTWRGLAAEVTAVAGRFAALAPHPDQRIGVLGENRIETVVAHLAGLLSGVGTVALSRQLTKTELSDQLADSGAVAVVTGPLGIAASLVAADAVDATVIAHNVDPRQDIPAGGAITTWADVASAAVRPGTEETDHAAKRPPRPPIVYTSGTTGRARGTEVRWLPRSFATAREYAAALAAKASFPSGAHLIVGPLQHNGPLTALRHIISGQPLVVLGRFDSERVLHLIERHSVTSSVMVPTHFQRLLALPADTRARYDVSSLVTVAHTGSACPPDVKRAMIDWWGPVLTESYGGSEIGTVCRITSEEWLAHPRSVGRCVPPFEVVVLDENGNRLPPGEVGVLGFRAPAGYDVEFHRDPEKTASAHIAPGVASLGDVGYVDEEGYVFITDRIADMVISGGVNLYPAEIERVLLTHPAIADAAVIGVPDTDLGESLLALIVIADDAEQPSERVLVDFLKRSLAGYKVPRRFRFVDEVSRNAMGKIDKKLLRKRYAETAGAHKEGSAL